MKKPVLSLKKSWFMVTLCALIMFAGCSKDPAMLPETVPDGQDVYYKSSVELTEAEIESLLFMVEEEKLAMDVYAFLYQLHGLKVFEQINLSEFNHVSAISRLLEKHELSNPIEGNLPGEFEDEGLQLFYNDLVTMGAISRLKAIEVGIIIEEKDMEDIQAYIDEVVEANDLERVYTHLLEGSARHLTSFLNELN